MNKTKIEWADYTWNPVVGCKHECPYCYAKRINNRFKMVECFTEPQYFPYRLDAPAKVKKSSTIFVGSMCDLFGGWVPEHWIIDTIKACEENSHHKFMFLTKNPKRYEEFDFPENCWLGATMPNYESLSKIYHTSRFFENSGDKKFISIEPILSGFMGVTFNNINLVIVGAMTGAGSTKPKKDWIYSIQHPNILYKENIKQYLK